MYGLLSAINHALSFGLFAPKDPLPRLTAHPARYRAVEEVRSFNLSARIVTDTRPTPADSTNLSTFFPAHAETTLSQAEPGLFGPSPDAQVDRAVSAFSALQRAYFCSHSAFLEASSKVFAIEQVHNKSLLAPWPYLTSPGS